MVSRSRFVGAVSAGALFVGVSFLLGGVETGRTTASVQPANPPVVSVARPTLRNVVEAREFAGRFEPSASVEIRARAAGHLRSIDFVDGDLIEAGQLLFTIDPGPYRTALEEARARLASAVAQIELTGPELRRAERLVSSNAVSQSALDQRRQQHQTAIASRELAEAVVKRAQIELGFTEVRAPFAGRVSNRRQDIGALVNEGTMLTTLVASDPIHFVFDVSEQDLLTYQVAARSGALPDLNQRQAIPVELQVRRGGDWISGGFIDFLDNRVERGTGAIRARARIANVDRLITPGQFGRVRIPFSSNYEALLVPETAVLTDQSRRTLLTVGDNGMVRAATVELGPLQQDGLRIVRSGIERDDRIVVRGLLRARPGQRVTARSVEPAPGEPVPAAGLVTDNDRSGG